MRSVGWEKQDGKQLRRTPKLGGDLPTAQSSARRPKSIAAAGTSDTLARADAGAPECEPPLELLELLPDVGELPPAPVLDEPAVELEGGLVENVRM